MVAASRPSLCHSTKVLLVEDNDISRQLMSDFLISCGYGVVSLSTAHALLMTLDRFNPDVLLLDLKLPDVDGYAVLKQLQVHPRWQHLPVIVISAFAFQADQQRALLLGARQYLTKPVKLLDVTTAIQAEVKPQALEAVV